MVGLDLLSPVSRAWCGGAVENLDKLAIRVINLYYLSVSVGLVGHLGRDLDCLDRNLDEFPVLVDLELLLVDDLTIVADARDVDVLVVT